MTRYFNFEGEIFAVEVGQESIIQIGWVELTPAEVDEIENPTPTAEEIINTQDLADIAEILLDADVKALILLGPDDIDTFIDDNSNNVAALRVIVKLLAKAISAIGKRQFR